MKKRGARRIDSVLLAIIIFSWCQFSEPWLYMSASFDRQKDEYIDRLYSTTGDWTGWVKFCLMRTIRQAKDTIKRCEEMRQLRDELHQRADGTSLRAHKIIEDLFEVPYVRASILRSRHRVMYPTARSDIDRLIEVGVLEEVGLTRPRSFCAPRIFEIAFREFEG